MSVERWVRMLKDGDAEQVREACESLGKLGPEAAEAVPALVRTLATTDVQAHAEWSEQWDDNPTGRAEMGANEPQFAYDCRIYAAEALGRIGPAARKAIPALVRAILDDRGCSDWGGSVSTSAAEALGRICPEAAPELLKALAGGELDEDAEEAIHEALGGYGVAASPSLLAALGGRSLPAEVRGGFAELIGDLGDAAVPALVAALPKARGPLFAAVAKLLGDLGTAAKEAVPVLEEAVRSRSAERRRLAADALERISGTGQ